MNEELPVRDLLTGVRGAHGEKAPHELGIARFDQPHGVVDDARLDNRSVHAAQPTATVVAKGRWRELARLPRAYVDLDESSLLADSILYATNIKPFIRHNSIPISQIVLAISHFLRDSKNRAACHYWKAVLTDEPVDGHKRDPRVQLHRPHIRKRPSPLSCKSGFPYLVQKNCVLAQLAAARLPSPQGDTDYVPHRNSVA